MSLCRAKVNRDLCVFIERKFFQQEVLVIIPKGSRSLDNFKRFLMVLFTLLNTERWFASFINMYKAIIGIY